MYSKIVQWACETLAGERGLLLGSAHCVFPQQIHDRRAGLPTGEICLCFLSQSCPPSSRYEKPTRLAAPPHQKSRGGERSICVWTSKNRRQLCSRSFEFAGTRAEVGSLQWRNRHISVFVLQPLAINCRWNNFRYDQRWGLVHMDRSLVVSIWFLFIYLCYNIMFCQSHDMVTVQELEFIFSKLDPRAITFSLKFTSVAYPCSSITIFILESWCDNQPQPDLSCTDPWCLHHHGSFPRDNFSHNSTFISTALLFFICFW